MATTPAGRVVVTVQHPAHVHFFRNAIDELEERGYDVRVFARAKDVTEALLEAYGIEYERLAGSAESPFELAKVQATYEYRLLKRVRRLDPDVMLAIGEPAVAHASAAVDGHSVLFTDTEHATLSNALALPFADLVCTPRAFWDDRGSSHYTYPGYHELAYLHPDRFSPDPSVLADLEPQVEAGLPAATDGGAASGTATGADSVEPGDATATIGDESLIVLRLISWTAAHDIGQEGMAGVERLVADLEREGATVLVSAEGDLPPALADRRIDLPPERMHDLLAHADLFLGESATMAIESAVLGTPSLYVSDLDAGVLEELETRYGLIRRLEQDAEPSQVAATARELLAIDDSTWRERRRTLFDETIDTTEFVVNTVERVSDA
ncbi:protein of unknown function DUF354 [Haloterrigena turkmenica DSM 5511]|uniref:DUF354 domain-containing protein n=1 Tax=Haloterrigena turkmenica (strain ATCC 51198 / DSM 5511 / JCM 9101 / NCIMB 13204 / VKM B-1734 / 4k) TaxID=543526 RepID=D2RVU4_HALTV|nr:DUF354 domain-containing protein [Haloterrigena turkmenica]ADB61373.1 protein of unknown function DUF354 [Haloterrigena turkmenica DSM 5511]